MVEREENSPTNLLHPAKLMNSWEEKNLPLLAYLKFLEIAITICCWGREEMFMQSRPVEWKETNIYKCRQLEIF